jgi:hypothetical protein
MQRKKGIEKGRKEGKEEGLQEGMEKGKEVGIQEGKLAEREQLVRGMHKMAWISKIWCKVYEYGTVGYTTYFGIKKIHPSYAIGVSFLLSDFY